MGKLPLVSVIIPTRNSAGTLKMCLQSIITQTYKNIEIIVVDNYSTDNTKIIARKFTDKVFDCGPERSTQRNYGAKRSKGKYLLFIDSDMELNRKVVEACVESIRSNKNIKGVVIPEKSFGEGFWAKCKKLERRFYLGVEWIEAARFFERELFFEMDGYDEQMTGTEDFDLPQRIKDKYGKSCIGRIGSFIFHYEGKLTLIETIRTKSYYAKALDTYKRVGIDNEYLKKQANLLTRYKLYFSDPKKLLKNPIIGLSMLFMKTLEFGFAGLTYYFQNKDNFYSEWYRDIHNEKLPRVSFVIPVYNAEKYLKLCLNSIQMQEYPKNKIEIIIIDGGSTDKTLQIAEKYKTKILNNPKRIAEYGKAIGIKASKGEYFILLDSDNEIVEKDWLKKMVNPVLENPDSLFGVESPLSYDRKLSSLNRYFARIRIADPFAKYLVSKPDKIVYKYGYKILEFNKKATLITGANGFLWNKKMVTGGWKDKFEEANYATYIHNKNNVNYAIPYHASVRHYYCQNLSDYIQKRKKIADKFIQRWRKKEFIWLKQVNPIQIALVVIYLGTLIGPFIESVYKSIKHKTTDYLWHPAISSITVIIYSLLFLREKYV